MRAQAAHDESRTTTPWPFPLFAARRPRVFPPCKNISCAAEKLPAEGRPDFAARLVSQSHFVSADFIERTLAKGVARLIERIGSGLGICKGLPAAPVGSFSPRILRRTSRPPAKTSGRARPARNHGSRPRRHDISSDQRPSDVCHMDGERCYNHALSQGSMCSRIQQESNPLLESVRTVAPRRAT